MSEINEHELEAQRCRALLKALADTPAIRCESVFRGDGTMNLVVTASGDFAQERLIAYHIASQWSLLFPSVASKGVDFREAAVALFRSKPEEDGSWPELEDMLRLGGALAGDLPVPDFEATELTPEVTDDFEYRGETVRHWYEKALAYDKAREALKEVQAQMTLVWLRTLLLTHVDWHDGAKGLVDPMWNEPPGPDEDPEQYKWFQDIRTGPADCPIRIFFNRDMEVLGGHVGAGGIYDAESAAQVAGVIASEIAANDDGFGLDPADFHPALRDLIFKELEGYSAPFLR